jgi:phosphoribosylglycinamide formyltransferase 1
VRGRAARLIFMPARVSPADMGALRDTCEGTGVVSSGAVRLGVLVSGRGTNLQAIIDAIAAGSLHARLAVVVSDRETAPALDRARRHGAPTIFLNPKDAEDRAAHDAALVRVLQEHRVDLVCLAGFMRLLGPGFLRAFPNRVLNIHPSLLPAFPGLGAQRQALAHGVKISGATVHFVDEGVDSGPIVVQEAVPILAGDTEESLSTRIREAEHRIYPKAIRLFAEGRLEIEGRCVRILEAREHVNRPAGGKPKASA